MTKIATYAIIGLLCVAMAAGVFLGGPPPSPPEQRGGDGTEPGVHPLSAAENQRMEAYRGRVKVLLKAAGGEPSIPATADGKLAALQRIIDGGRVPTTSSEDRRALGVVFGDALVQSTGAKWMAFDDGGRRKLVVLPGGLLPTKAFQPGPDGVAQTDVRGLFTAVQQSIKGQPGP